MRNIINLIVKLALTSGYININDIRKLFGISKYEAEKAIKTIAKKHKELELTYKVILERRGELVNFKVEEVEEHRLKNFINYAKKEGWIPKDIYPIGLRRRI